MPKNKNKTPIPSNLSLAEWNRRIIEAQPRITYEEAVAQLTAGRKSRFVAQQPRMIDAEEVAQLAEEKSPVEPLPGLSPSDSVQPLRESSR